MKEVKIRLFVVSAFIQRNGKFLIVQRASFDTHPAMWEAPGGGVDWGEDPADCIKREVKEECGLDVKVGDPIKLFSWTSTRDNKKRHMIQVVYTCTLINEQQEVTLSAEHSAYRWIDVSELKDMNLSFFLESLSTTPHK